MPGGIGVLRDLKGTIYRLQHASLEGAGYWQAEVANFPRSKGTPRRLRPTLIWRGGECQGRLSQARYSKGPRARFRHAFFD
jgi:hypothetical protein